MIFFLVAAMVAAENPTIYSQLKRFELSSAADVHNLVIRKDRIEIQLDGKLFLETAQGGKIHGAVFTGNGRLKIEPPPVEFEKGNLQRILRADSIDTTFENAVFRISGDGLLPTIPTAQPQAPSAEAKDLAEKFEPRLLKRTGLNATARVFRSIVNEETGSFLLMEIDKSPLGRLGVLYDDEGQIPSAMFGFNAGERGVVFRSEQFTGGDIVLAFLPKESYETGRFQYSDVFQAVDVQKYAMKIDGTEAGKRMLRNAVEISGRHLRPSRALFFEINAGLEEYDDERRKRSMAVTGATRGGTALAVIQEPWEIGVTVVLDEKPAAGQPLQITLATEGKSLFTAEQTALGEDIFYPETTTSWFPNNGYLDRAHYEMEFQYPKGFTAIAPGLEVDPTAQKTVWRTEREVGFSSFSVGRFQVVKSKTNRTGTEIHAYTPSMYLSSDKSTFLLTELSNTIDLFGEWFGAYPFATAKSVYHPRPFGQGFPSMTLLAPGSFIQGPRDSAFISHEVSHQWWGNLVGWRSYRDQWLSEGFAEYSAALYLKLRFNQEATNNLVRGWRNRLLMPPLGEKGGVGKGRVNDIGPMILGRRLATSESRNAYSALTYTKGGLVLRMVHFLLTNPADGNDTMFFDMLKDFVKRYQDRPASTEDFANVAGEHFARSPLGRKYSFRHLGWFFRQWVFQSHLPSYRLEYRINKQADGRALLEGTLYQEGAPNNWEMPLPLTLRFDKDQVAKGSVIAKGPSIAVSLPLPAAPKEVLLDPDNWVLSQKTTTVKLP